MSCYLVTQLRLDWNFLQPVKARDRQGAAQTPQGWRPGGRVRAGGAQSGEAPGPQCRVQQLRVGRHGNGGTEGQTHRGPNPSLPTSTCPVSFRCSAEGPGEAAQEVWEGGSEGARAGARLRGRRGGEGSSESRAHGCFPQHRPEGRLPPVAGGFEGLPGGMKGPFPEWGPPHASPSDEVLAPRFRGPLMTLLVLSPGSWGPGACRTSLAGT